MLNCATDTAALRHNALHIRKTAGVPLIAVVKHGAYGCGMAACAAALAGLADAFAVETVAEARTLSPFAKGTPIHVLAPLFPEDLKDLPAGVILPVDTPDIIDALCGIYMKEPVPVQLRADVDNSGIGLSERDFYTVLRRVTEDPRLCLRGMFAHSPSLYNRADTDAVAARFARLAQAVHEKAPRALCHLAAGSGWQDPRLRFDAVRAGTNLYGLPSFEGQPTEDLLPVLTLSTKLVRVFSARRLRFYSGRFDAEKPHTVGIAAAGYGHLPALIRAHGLRVLVGGVSVPVLGSPAMGHMMVDLSALADARAGEEVVLVGRSGNEVRTARQFAAACGIPLCRCEGALFTAAALQKGDTHETLCPQQPHR